MLFSGADHAATIEHSSARRDRVAQLLEKVLVNSFDLKGVFDPASDIVPDHEFG